MAAGRDGPHQSCILRHGRKEQSRKQTAANRHVLRELAALGYWHMSATEASFVPR